jgi:hypothetical protein
VDVVVAGETEGKTTAVGAVTVEEAVEVAADVTDREVSHQGCRVSAAGFSANLTAKPVTEATKVEQASRSRSPISLR